MEKFLIQQNKTGFFSSLLEESGVKVNTVNNLHHFVAYLTYKAERYVKRLLITGGPSAIEEKTELLSEVLAMLLGKGPIEQKNQ
jgi:hypothetical protein